MQQLSSIHTFLNIVKIYPHVYMYKYNPNNCRLSRETKPLIEQSEYIYSITWHRIDVIADKQLIQYISDHRDIQHESPQCIVFSDGKILAHTSHKHITGERIKQHIVKKTLSS